MVKFFTKMSIFIHLHLLPNQLILLKRFGIFSYFFLSFFLVFSHAYAQQQAIPNVLQLKEQLGQATDSIEVADVCIKLYRTYKYKLLQENPHEGELLIRALKIYEGAKDWERTAYVYNALAGMHYNRQQYEAAKKYWQYAIEFYQKVGNQKRVAVMYNNISIAYGADTTIASQLIMKDYLERALTLYLELRDTASATSAYINLGAYYRNTGDFKQAEAYFQQVVQGSKRFGQTTSTQAVYYHLGILRKLQGRKKEAIQLIEKSLTYNAIRKTDPNVMDAIKLLSELYAEVGKHKQAFERQLTYQQLKDTLHQDNLSKKLVELEARYTNEKNQQEIVNLKAQEKSQQVALDAERESKFYLMLFAIFSAIGLMVTGKLYRDTKIKQGYILSQKEELEELNQTKNRFFGIIAHDLRGPLTALQGITGLLDYNIKKKKFDYLPKIATQIETSGQKVTTLLDNLLQWALKQEGAIPFQPQTLPLLPLIDESVSHFKDMAKAKNLALSVQVAESLTVYADKDSLSTVFRNLLNNSIKFTPSDGTIHIIANKKQGEVFIQVSDTGIGIPKDRLPTLFQLDDTKIKAGTDGEKGSGLGLVLVHDFVMMNQGKIEVKSTLNQGTTFSIQLPTSKSK